MVRYYLVFHYKPKVSNKISDYFTAAILLSLVSSVLYIISLTLALFISKWLKINLLLISLFYSIVYLSEDDLSLTVALSVILNNWDFMEWLELFSFLQVLI